jgi:hypothetical protein
MKRKFLIKLLLFFFLILSPFAAIVSFYYAIPDQYTSTYVGELENMFDRLKSITKPKIIVVGGSNVTFGLRSEVVEEELGMPCVDFGLYATIGTKTMMDLSKVNIGKGDIVVFAPETAHQTLSLYFNPDATLRALNTNNEMLSYIPEDNKLQMANELPGYLSTNFSVFTGKSQLKLSGIYQRSSFNAYGDIAYPRPYNVMEGLADSVSKVFFSKDIIDKDFISYVNDYAAFVRSKGASIYYSYSPMNKAALASTAADIKAYEDFISAQFDMEILSNARDYLLEPKLFYDTNFHCNDVGVYYRVNQLVSDLKRMLGISTPNHIALSPAPDVPATPITPGGADDGKGNNTDVACFNYALVGTSYAIESLTEEGKNRSELTVPYAYNSIKVTRILSGAFKDDAALKKLNLQTSISQVQNAAFDGASALEGIYLAHSDPTSITVGMAGGLLEGVSSSCYVYVPSASLSLFQNDYNWEAYRSVLRGY